jgi:hypothetical protein
MASPVDAGRAQTNISTAADPWTVNLPGSIVSGDLLLMYTRQAGATGGGSNAGWSGVNGINDDGSDASDDVTDTFWKIADGTEGATISWDQGGSTKGAAICWRITGSGLDPGTSTTPIFTNTVVTSAAANINPGACTPTGGSADYLFISIVGMDSETGTATNAGLSNVVSANSGTGGAVATNCIIWGGSVAATTASQDVGAWTSSAPASGASAWTIAVYPATAAPPTLILEQGFVNFSDPGVL